jgi:hypothetical protein
MFKKEFKKSIKARNKEKSIIKIESELDSAFQEFVDTLLFTNRMDFDLSKFISLLKANSSYISNILYILDRFKKASLIQWENAEELWNYRIKFLFSTNEKMLIKQIDSYINDQIYSMLRVDINYNQFIELSKVRKQLSLSLFDTKKTLLSIPAFFDKHNILEVINEFIPHVFPNIESYLFELSKRIITNSYLYEVLLYFEAQGFAIDKSNMIQTVKDLIFKRYPSWNEKGLLISLLKDPKINSEIKVLYSSAYSKKLKRMISQYTYKSFDCNYMEIPRVLIELDPALANPILESYIDSLIEERFRHKRAIPDKVIKLLKLFPQMKPKKALLKFKELKHSQYVIEKFTEAFPELKGLVVFI